MSRQVVIRDIMTHKVICAGLDNKLSQVIEFFAKFKIQHLPVIDDKKIVGVISVNDILRFMNEHLQKSETITCGYLDKTFSLENVMTKNPVTMSPEDPIEKAFTLLAPGNFKCIIVAENDVISGIITNKDLVRYHVTGFNTDYDNFTIGAPGFGI